MYLTMNKLDRSGRSTVNKVLNILEKSTFLRYEVGERISKSKNLPGIVQASQYNDSEVRWVALCAIRSIHDNNYRNHSGPLPRNFNIAVQQLIKVVKSRTEEDEMRKSVVKLLEDILFNNDVPQRIKKNITEAFPHGFPASLYRAEKKEEVFSRADNWYTERGMNVDDEGYPTDDAGNLVECVNGQWRLVDYCN